MVKKLFVLWMLALCYSCSPEPSTEVLPQPVSNFEVTLTPSVNEVFLDVPFSIKVKSTEELYEISRTLENGVQSMNPLMPGEALDVQLHLQFGTLGTHQVVLEFISMTGKKLNKTLSFEVKRGNAAKITGFKINSFYNMYGSWDEEYAETDDNRLADIVFAFRKTALGHFNKPQPLMATFYRSPVYPNMQQLEWDLSGAELYVGDTSSFDFGVGDADEDGTGQDLTMGYHGVRIRFIDLRETRPTEIHIKDEESGFDVTFQLEWM